MAMAPNGVGMAAKKTYVRYRGIARLAELELQSRNFPCFTERATPPLSFSWPCPVDLSRMIESNYSNTKHIAHTFHED